MLFDLATDLGLLKINVEYPSVDEVMHLENYLVLDWDAMDFMELDLEAMDLVVLDYEAMELVVAH